jgi:hypothetical protein
MPAGMAVQRLDDLKMAVAGPGEGTFRIGWVCYDKDAPYPDIVRQVPHLAFEVDDLDAAIAGKTVIIAPTSPTPGLRLAFVEHAGAPVEFLEVDRTVLPDGI